MIVSVYLPSKRKEKECQMKILENVLQSITPGRENVIILGDFNGVTNPFLDRSPRKTSSRAEGKIFSIMKEHKLKDIMRTAYKSKRIFTWKARGLASRIDAIWGPKCLLEGFRKIEVIDTEGYLDTDHRMVILTVERSTALDQKIKVKDRAAFKPFATVNTTPEKWKKFTEELEGILEREKGESSQDSLNTQWEIFSSALINSANRNIPRRKERREPKKWRSKIYNDFKRLVRLRRLLQKELRIKEEESTV